MILKEIKIRNFRSYYGNDNRFELSPGLTLILGDNSDGKTTFFEALEWLFYTATEDKSETNISEMRKSELAEGEEDTVSVTLSFDHDGEKELIKSFVFKKGSNNNVSTYGYKFVGYETVGAERVQVDGKRLLERCFDTIIRKYCLFKGESELNIFNGSTALNSLVDTFSDVRKFKEYVDMTTEFENKSQAVVEKEMRNDKKAEQQARILSSDLNAVKRDIADVKNDLKEQEQAVTDYSSRLEVLERNQSACEQYQEIKKRIEQKRQELMRFKNYVDVDYNAELLDDYWILRSFAPILNEFASKVSKLSKEKRKLEKQEDEKRGYAKAQHEVVHNIQKLANGAAPLPWNLPDKETMQEMIDEEVCKVCGRPALKGTPEYNFMVEKLNTYLRKVEEEAHRQLEDTQETPLFENEYVEELRNISLHFSGETEQWIANIATEISDRLSFIQARKLDVERVSAELQEAEDEKTRLLLQSQGLTEDLLETSFADFKGYSEQKERAVLKIERLTNQLNILKARKQELEEKYNAIETENSSVKIYQRVHQALKKIMDAFQNAKEKNITDFLDMLKKEANNYMETLNGNDFRGIIEIVRKMDGSAEIQLYSSNGTIISKPGGSQKTTMYMSVLFAISKITTLKREQDYPLIFDAPTSSFGDIKEEVFYNTIDKIDKQCIIVTKDLLIKDEVSGKAALRQDKINELTCSVYRIEKEAGFDANDLSTIRTMITPIK